VFKCHHRKFSYTDSVSSAFSQLKLEQEKKLQGNDDQDTLSEMSGLVLLFVFYFY
jgi:hypothetical protein